MYAIKNLSPARRTYGDLTVEPGHTRNVPDAQMQHLGPALISRINDDNAAQVLRVVWTSDVPGLNLEPVSINPAFATPFGIQLMQAVDADAANAALGGSSGGGYTLPAATASALGGVKIGSGLAVTADGTLSRAALTATDIPSLDAAKIATGTLAAARLGSGTATASTVLLGSGAWGAVPTATTTVVGGVTVAAVATSGLTLTGAALSVPAATTSQRGTVRQAATVAAVVAGADDAATIQNLLTGLNAALTNIKAAGLMA